MPSPSLDHVAQQVTGLAGEDAAHDHVDAERLEHPRLPDALACGMDVDLRATAVVILDSDAHDR